MKPSLPYMHPIERYEESLRDCPDLPPLIETPWRAIALGVSLSLVLGYAIYHLASWWLLGRWG